MNRSRLPLFFAALSVSWLALAQVVSVNASVETSPALTSGDAVDDPAVWIHPTDVGRSLIIGTDKQSGLFTYELDGKQVQQIGGLMGNVDIRYNFPLGGASVALVVVNERSSPGRVRVFKVDPATRQLVDVGVGTPLTNDGYGGCMYRSASSNKYYFFSTDKSGLVQQLELADDGAGKVKATMVREFDVGGQIEGCSADDQLGNFFVGEEAVGIFRYSAEPAGGTTRIQVDTTSGGHVVADVEGLSIYRGGGETGYLIASSQGNDTFSLYQRKAPFAFVGTFRVADGNGFDGAEGCDGIDVVNVALGAAFPKGVFIAQDTANPGANQNFKLVPWERIASAFPTALVIDPTGFDPRTVGTVSPPVTADAGSTPPVVFDAGSTPPGTSTGADAGKPTQELPGTPAARDGGASASGGGADDGTAQGCGCSNSSGLGGTLLVGLALLVLGRRRRSWLKRTNSAR